MHTYDCSRPLISSAILILLLLSASPSPADVVNNSEWKSDLESLEESLRAHKWKPARRAAQKLGKKVMNKSWYGPNLDKVLAEAALAQAIAGANLGDDGEAVWYWHVAINLNHRIRDRDLGPYGRAGKLLYEFPLRAHGEVPVGFENRERGPLNPSHPPKVPDVGVPTFIINLAGVETRQGDFHVEVIVDKEGRLHHPVVESTYLHPILIYAVLDWLARVPPFEPRRFFEGGASDSLYDISMDFNSTRW